jgi:hypothetical protein
MANTIKSKHQPLPPVESFAGILSGGQESEPTDYSTSELAQAIAERDRAVRALEEAVASLAELAGADQQCTTLETVASMAQQALERIKQLQAGETLRPFHSGVKL